MTLEETYSELEKLGADVTEIKKTNPTEEQLDAIKNGILKLSQRLLPAGITE